jgi:hypothetical protein
MNGIVAKARPNPPQTFHLAASSGDAPIENEGLSHDLVENTAPLSGVGLEPVMFMKTNDLLKTP